MPVIQALVQWKLAYEISPVTLTGGLLANFPGGGMPILSLTQPDLYGGGLLSYAFGGPDDLDQYFAHWVVLPTSTLLDNTIGEYPFANQQVAANALIFQPRRISLMMICPATIYVGHFTRAAVLSNMIETLRAHNLAGGLYTVATPAYVYDSTILERIQDASPVVSATAASQTQFDLRFDFVQPLVTQAQAQMAMNTALSKLSSGAQLNAPVDWSGLSATTGNPQSGVTPPIVPTSQPQPSTLVTGLAAPAASYPLQVNTPSLGLPQVPQNSL